MKFYKIKEENEIVTNYQIQYLQSNEYELITKKDSELMIDEFWYPESTLRNEKLDNLFQKKFEEHSYNNPDLSKFTQLRAKMEKCASFIDMWRLIQELSNQIMRDQYQEWLDENYPRKVMK